MRWRQLAWGLAGAVFLLMLYRWALPGDLVVGQDRSPGLSGAYTVNGVDPTGVEYSGTAFITEGDDATTFMMQWIITGTIQEGSGRLSGDVFTVEWETISSAGGAGRGTASYVVEPDGRLVGTRTIEGVDEIGTEEIFPEA